jgi:hypothetical protein
MRVSAEHKSIWERKVVEGRRPSELRGTLFAECDVQATLVHEISPAFVLRYGRYSADDGP